jgi:hypothetical protein
MYAYICLHCTTFLNSKCSNQSLSDSTWYQLFHVIYSFNVIFILLSPAKCANVFSSFSRDGFPIYFLMQSSQNVCLSVFRTSFSVYSIRCTYLLTHIL